ncbi:unnamed protein product [Discula destructiva]
MACLAASRDRTANAPRQDAPSESDPVDCGLAAVHVVAQQQQFPGLAQSQTTSQPAQSVQAQPEGATKDGASDNGASCIGASGIGAHPSLSTAEHEPVVSDRGSHGTRPLDSSSTHLQDSGSSSLSSPRHELELIPEDRPISTPHHADSTIASTTTASSAVPPSNDPPAASTPDTGSNFIRPVVHRPAPHPLSPRPSTRSPISSSLSILDEPPSPTIIRTASGSSRLRHPTPDINARSGSYTGNIAALEATAERFSMTSSIDDAIREAHNELKRSDSRRSSILAASVKSGDYATDSHLSLLPSLSVGQQSSIVGSINAARTGGYSPGGFVMSPTQSITGRLRSGSKGSSALSRADSTRSKPETLDGEAFPDLSGSMMSSLSRHGPETGSIQSAHSLRSVHSVQSLQSIRSGAPLSLAEIAEMEPPSGLTQAAMDEADRTVPQLENLEDDDEDILARALQQVEPDATDIEVAEQPNLHAIDDWDRTPMMEEFDNSYWDNHEESSTLHVRNPADQVHARAYGGKDSPTKHQHADHDNPDTIDDDDNVFADFDGMHCDPDSVAEHFPHHSEEDRTIPAGQRLPGPPQPRPQAARTERPKSYFDPATGQNMLYYPARVPAMLNLPPKLGKGVKAAEAARNVRRSQLLSQMPTQARESRFWLPDPLEGSGSMKLDPVLPMDDDLAQASQHSSTGELGPEQTLAALERPATQTAFHENSPLESPGLQNLRRPPRLGDPDVRQSRMNMSDLPPQLRASAFFDMPKQSLPKIEVKDGSAMATLDSILDAAASAPVSAFTDHAYAGHLGKEVYGVEKKKNRQSQLTLAPAAGDGKANRLSKSASTLALPEADKRRSVWSLLSGRGKSRSSANLLAVQEADARSNLQGSVDDDASDVDETSALSPDHESDSDEEQFSGQPTTLLAELQMRKKQQEKRTKNPLHHGEVLHSTLLELDAVAEYEAQSRQKKKVNLAWAGESPDAGSEDDEDVPLGLLAAQKQLGSKTSYSDLAFAAQELNRPLGLMERRELDDNEPLSRRRDRLQGKTVPVSMYLQASGNATRLSMLPGSRSVSPLRMVGAVSPGASAPSPNLEDEEHSGETLGERRRRLCAEADGDNPLPRARRVSGAFSSELLSELGINEKDNDGEKAKENAAPVIEEEETLGQRRRRLQAEKEAREKEMGARPVSDENQQGPISRRLNMADILAANPLDTPGSKDPHEVERRRNEDESARYAREQEAKMRAFRAQVPKALGDPKAGVLTPGGYQNGRFNDNRGGFGGSTGSVNGPSHVPGGMSVSQMGMQQNHHLQGQSTNLIGAAGNYNNYSNAGPNSVNPIFAKSDPFGNGYKGGILQSHPQFNNRPQTFVSGSLLASGGYGAFGGGIGAAGGYSANQTAYGGGVGFVGGAPPMGYGMQAGGLQMMTGKQQADLVERWRQGIR